MKKLNQWKRSGVVAVVLLFVCVAVYLNWSYGQTELATGQPQSDTTKTLGEAELVGERTMMEQGGNEIVTVSELPEESYFDTARLSRQESRDAALAMLQKTVNDPNADATAVFAASEGIETMAADTIAETEIENLVTAKGYQDCVAYIGDNSVSVVVSTSGEGLEAADVAKVTDIVMGQTSFSANQVKIIEAGKE